MPKQLEQDLFAEGRKKGLTGDKLNAYVYGTMRNTGWKPSTQKKSEPTYEINSNMKNYGDHNAETDHIRINPKKGDVVNTIIHERLHHDFPNMAHDKVYENASKIESKMSLPEMAGAMLAVHSAAQEGVCTTTPTPKGKVTDVPRIHRRN